ncbi:MAG: hypothetical protein ACYTGW_17555, partial [Planctomycetota bacterium]
PELGFTEYLERLVRIGTDAAAAKQRGDKTRFAVLNAEGRELLDEMLRRLEAPAEAALDVLTGLMTEDTTVAGRIRRAICLQLVRLGLETRLERFRRGDRRDPLDHLTLSILACIPQDEVLAKDLAGLLQQQPYLGARQENAVLDLVALAQEQRFLIPIATELLVTLWRNLEASGTRSSADLASLALLFKDDVNPSRRLAALRHLLTASGGRYKELVLRDAIGRRDPQLLGELALAISRRLPPKQAVGDLLRISQVSRRGLTSALLALGTRDARVLRDAYDKHLADDRHAGFRGELITGAGFQQDAVGLELALEALELDPDPDVRCRALMVVTSRADTQVAEQRLMALLDQAHVGNSPGHLGQVVLALENLATRDCPNTLRRVADRLLATGKLRPGDERRLRRLRDGR